MTHRLFVTLLCLALLVPVAFAAEPAIKPAKKPDRPKPPQRHQQIDHGPFVTATIASQWEDQGITNKGIAVKLEDFAAPGAEKTTGGVLFDTDTCRVAAGWTGGFINFAKDWTNVRDSKSVSIVGHQIFGNTNGPGWAKPGATGSKAWSDPRTNGFGPLPRDWLAYKGLYRFEKNVVFSYSVGGVDVLEGSAVIDLERTALLTKALEIAPATGSRDLLVAEAPPEKITIDGDRVTVRQERDGKTVVTLFCLVRFATDAEWVAEKSTDRASRLLLRFPPRANGHRVTVFAWESDGAEDEIINSAIFAKARDLPSAFDASSWITAYTKGGPALWPQTITTSGKLADPRDKNAPYVVDTITLPDDNPWKSWMRPGGFDFFTSDPTKAAICNWSGDVWTVSGLTGDLKELKWRRIASGLFQPLGLRIVNDQIYVVGRDQVTKLVDLNGDGETDFYECFNNDMEVTPNFHEFTFGLETDRAGNFYFAKGGPVRNGGQGFETIAAHHGAVLKLSPDGKTLERYATGFRAPTGIGISPEGQITAGDNEGSWVPKCRLAWVKPGGFYGVVPTAHRNPPPTDYDRPLCWFPKDVDNSSGGQAWVTSDKWGPFQNRLLHLSYGTCSLFLAMKQDLQNVPNAAVQGGVVRFPLSFDSGIMRARFNPADGQLYVAGGKGWQTSAGKDGCFQRVRYTGKPVHMPTSIEATKSGLKIGFTCKLSEAEANDVESYAIERWNYRWSEGYGSPDFSIDDPKKSAHDTVKIKSAKLQPDGRTVNLEIPDMKPAMQYKTEVNLVSDDDADVRFEIYHTVHALP